MLLYDYEYDIAAIIVTVCMLFSFSLKKTFIGKSGKIFTSIIVFDLLAAIFDCISCFTISNPQDYSLWFNYVVSLGYLFFYNCMNALHLIYIDSKTHVPWLKRFTAIYAHCTIVFYFITIVSSPYTHLVAYFDSNGQYMHGPLMLVLYILPFVNFVIEIIMFVSARKRLSPYQMYASIMLIAAMCISIAVTVVFPRVLIGQLVMATIMFFVFLGFENPAYYTYKETPCLNIVAFQKALKYTKQSNDAIFLLASIGNYPSIKANNNIATVNTLNNMLCDSFYNMFRKRVYCIEDSYFVIYITKQEEEEARKQITEAFEQPIEIEDTNKQIRCEIEMDAIYDLGADFTYEEKEKVIVNRFKEHNIKGKSVREELEHIINKEKHESLILDEIKKAVEAESFLVYYQPIYSYADKKFKSAEALLRLRGENTGCINPEEMVILAEKNGYIDEIGRIVFDKVCRFISENDLKSKGIEYIEVNLSPIQCNREDIVEEFVQIMNKYNVDPNQINLEITETADSGYLHNVKENIRRFDELGVKFSIDDFGSGFASLNYLIKYPVSIIKIDKEILWNAMENDEAMVVLTNSIQLAKELKKEVVVEGVETFEMLKLLNKLECDFQQGYFYSKPICEADFIEYIESHNF